MGRVHGIRVVGTRVPGVGQASTRVLFSLRFTFYPVARSRRVLGPRFLSEVGCTVPQLGKKLGRRGGGRVSAAHAIRKNSNGESSASGYPPGPSTSRNPLQRSLSRDF